jgi:glycosyltransferase involved in cell wall biosynthesis
MATVSIIVPCYNAQAWVKEAIQSCLNQTYPDIEIIVIDDGSTDRSAQVLKDFGSRILLVTTSNQGGSVARNIGFRHSTGKYIQFLDADDYLLPEKIAMQVRFLEENNADVVYGDWRYQFHLPDGFCYLDKIEKSGEKDDILCSLLSGWWVAQGAILYRRWAVESVGGWDESFRAAQDRDFFTSVAMSNVVIGYQPGCNFIYRKYGEVTVSTSNIQRWFNSNCLSLEKTETALRNSDRLSKNHRASLATGYARALRFCLPIRTERHFEILRKIQDLAPNFKAKDETIWFRLVQEMLGYCRTIRLMSLWRAALSTIKSALKKTFLLKIVLRLRRLRIMYSVRNNQRVAIHDRNAAGISFNKPI